MYRNYIMDKKFKIDFFFFFRLLLLNKYKVEFLFLFSADLSFAAAQITFFVFLFVFPFFQIENTMIRERDEWFSFASHLVFSAILEEVN